MVVCYYFFCTHKILFYICTIHSEKIHDVNISVYSVFVLQMGICFMRFCHYKQYCDKYCCTYMLIFWCFYFCNIDFSFPSAGIPCFIVLHFIVLNKCCILFCFVLQTEGKTFYQQKDYNLLHCNTHFIAMFCIQTHSISEVCL